MNWQDRQDRIDRTKELAVRNELEALRAFVRKRQKGNVDHLAFLKKSRSLSGGNTPMAQYEGMIEEDGLIILEIVRHVVELDATSERVEMRDQETSPVDASVETIAKDTADPRKGLENGEKRESSEFSHLRELTSYEAGEKEGFAAGAEAMRLRVSQRHFKQVHDSGGRNFTCDECREINGLGLEVTTDADRG